MHYLAGSIIICLGVFLEFNQMHVVGGIEDAVQWFLLAGVLVMVLGSGSTEIKETIVHKEKDEPKPN